MRIWKERYQELEDRALNSQDPEAVEDLALWFISYGSQCCNGESYAIRDGLRLFPVYEESEESEDDPKLVGWEIR